MAAAVSYDGRTFASMATSNSTFPVLWLQFSHAGNSYPSGDIRLSNIERCGTWSIVVAGVLPPQKQHHGLLRKNSRRLFLPCPKPFPALGSAEWLIHFVA